MKNMNQWEHDDRRESPRLRLRLRLAVVYPQREGRTALPIYHGASHDIGMSGLSMLAEDNIFHEGEVKILLALPPAHSWASQKIITATVEMTYAIRSSKLNAYKIGMTFREFKEDGKALLQAALGRAPTKDAAPGTQDADPVSRMTQPIDSQPLGC